MEGPKSSADTGAAAKAGNVDTELTMPIYNKGKYDNPWLKWSPQKYFDILYFFLSRFTADKSNIPNTAELDRTLPVLKPDMTKFSSSPKSGVRHLWIGHATSLIQMDGLTILTDPVFSNSCSPVQLLGPKRYRPPACTVDELPQVDCVVISHNHYDHLDHGSVAALHARFGNKLKWYVPQGLKDWLNSCSCENVVEMTWWEEHVHSAESNVTFVCTPCQHWTGRNLLDYNTTLWSSWAVIGPKHRFFFAGDTAHCEAFGQIGKKYGPFTLATIPIGAYHPSYIMKTVHADPKSAVNIHEDIKAETSVGIHWGTFSLAYEPYMEPKQLLKDEIEKRNMKPSSFFTVKHGQIIVVGHDHHLDVD